MEFSTCALYSNLLKDVGVRNDSEIGDPQNARTPREAARWSICHSLLKKFKDGQTDGADSAALLKFLEANHRSRNWVLILNTSSDEELWGEFKSALDRFWHRGGFALAEATDLQALEKGRVGPGTSVGAIGESLYAKLFASKISSTSMALYNSYKSYISRFPLWHSADELRSATVGSVDVVEGSRLSFVPKNNTISRCICTEPVLNMFLQLGLGRVISERLKSFYGIDLENQQFRNRDLARIGSILDSNVTIDLASASDSIGLRLCEEALPHSMSSLLKRYRCASSYVPGLGLYELDIMSSMGNGYTFPLQTLIFCAMVEASFVMAGVPFPVSSTHKEWGVYGDDIIVPRGKIERCLLRLLGIAGFLVNGDKSFFEGRFRESCGSDYYAGVDVRGIYLTRLSTTQDFFVAINRLNVFSARTGVFLCNTVRYLMGFVPRRCVPLHENEDAGLRVPLQLASSLSRRGYILTDRNGTYCYQAYAPSPKRILFLEDRLSVPRMLRNWSKYWYNPDGALLAFLQRSLDGCAIAVRLNRVAYALVRRRTPNWDMTPATHPEQGWFPWQRLGDAVYMNMLF